MLSPDRWRLVETQQWTSAAQYAQAGKGSRPAFFKNLARALRRLET
jgi:hypothetical protein